MNIGSIWNYWNLIGWTLSTVYFSDAILLLQTFIDNELMIDIYNVF